VKHSPRFAGKAKYGFSNRAFRALVDLLAVRWMKKRYLRYEVREMDRVSEPMKEINREVVHEAGPRPRG
jgi:hypothetical protein